MPVKLKINIIDDSELRNALVSEYDLSSQIKLCKYALMLAAHILTMVNYQYMDNAVINEGFLIHQKWQEGKAGIHELRQVGFKIHKMAKACDDIVIQTALRVVGQAISTGHMKEHAIVASDYAIKVVNLLLPDDMNAIRQERIWQINHLKHLEEFD